MSKSEVSQRQKTLDQARIQLKDKFYGIDPVIDQLIDGITSWYLYPDFQQRPLILNLWGMTGVGKSDLVHQLVKLLHFENKYFRFDMGEFSPDSRLSIGEQVSNACVEGQAVPHIFLLDEFQLARAIRESGHEISNTSMREVWQLLDEGKISRPNRLEYRKTAFQTMVRNFPYWMERGLEVKDGMVGPEFREFFSDLTDRTDGDEEEENTEKSRFVFNQIELYALLSIYYPRFENTHHLRGYIKTLTTSEIAALLQDAQDRSSKPIWLDFSKSLFFVAGNLDEVYHQSKDQSPDISPDEFHRNSLLIQLPHVKKALLKRFRSEQIARLGNNHLIYPSLDAAAFERLIGFELDSIASRYSMIGGISIRFDSSVHDWLFQEGVVPTQGVRPLKSSIRYGVEDKMPEILSHSRAIGKPIDEVYISIKDAFKVEFTHQGFAIDSTILPLTEKVNSLKKTRNNELQAQVAVHEVGHAIAHMAFSGKIPKKILSVVADSEHHGLVVVDSVRNFTFKSFQNHIIELLGGFEAERLVFGENLVSDGSESDIERATRLSMNQFKDCGFGGELIKIAEHREQYEPYYHQVDKMEDRVKSFMEEARRRVRIALERDRFLLLKMAGQLADHSSMAGREIERYVAEYGSDVIQEKITSEKTSFREILLSLSKSSKNPLLELR